MKPLSIWLGFDTREASAFAVAKASVRDHLVYPVPVRGVVLERLQSLGLYTRPTERRGSMLWDVISDAPMSTEFAISRFLVPHLAGKGWALFMDSDILVRKNLTRIFDDLSPSKAVYCVKHQFEPPAGLKMDSQLQLPYARKNWSSVMLFNCDHPSNAALTPDMVNRLPGRELHAFSWLKDEEIGELDPSWNWLAGHSDASIDPRVVHFTDGFPLMAGYEDAPYADEWRAALFGWAQGRPCAGS